MQENKKDISIFIFRNDLRLQDNIGLIEALKNSKKVIPIYLLENLDLFNLKNYNKQQFIIETLIDLDKELTKSRSRLFVIKNISELIKIIKKNNIDSIFLNRLYHPKHILQEKKLSDFCKKQDMEFNIYNDFLLNEPSESKKVYKVYTPFLRYATKKNVSKSVNSNKKNYVPKNFIKSNIDISKLLKNKNENIHKHGGRTNGKKILRNLKKYKNYKEIRDYPAIDGTTKLSAYINVGALSIREIYHKIIKLFSKRHELIRQLYWREFFYQLYYNMPELFKDVLRKRNIRWTKSKTFFNKWKKGKTGIPLIDAGMKELNETGYMHNRIRMLVSNNLSLKEKVDWRLGEKYFAKKLTDYDPILNNGNWQYMVQVGANTAPFPRILNPELQLKKFDKDFEYIEKWD
ncbi:deoxyribodipyrimidine photo-lyase [Candidatus Dependentiae bacterium]|nr:deoxyribodipyrimidine photo-lyase [Candidatus Dependentiae bacterium]